MSLGVADLKTFGLDSGASASFDIAAQGNLRYVSVWISETVSRGWQKLSFSGINGETIISTTSEVQSPKLSISVENKSIVLTNNDDFRLAGRFTVLGMTW